MLHCKKTFIKLFFKELKKILKNKTGKKQEKRVGQDL